MKILVTGAAGFIGYHMSQRLIEMGYHVVGIDNLNDYYDVRLKEARLAKLQQLENFHLRNLISLTQQKWLNYLHHTNLTELFI